jgi:hypothetical protein
MRGIEAAPARLAFVSSSSVPSVVSVVKPLGTAPINGE